MSFLRKIIGGQSSPPPSPARFRVDYANGDPVGRAWVNRLELGDWLGFTQMLEQEQDRHRRDLYLRAAAGSFKGRPGWIESWPKIKPDSGLPYLLRGLQGTDWAWQARGHKRAAQVSAEAFELFHERLATSREDLMKAAQLLPDDPAPWVAMIRVAMGLGASTQDLLGIYTRVRERDPWHPEAHPAMVKALAAKWRGSDDKMFEFLRKVSKYAPEGSPAWAASPQAHTEVFTDRRSQAYYDEPGVREEIAEAAAKSIDLRRGDRDPWLVGARAIFAFSYMSSGDYDRLRVELEELDDIVTGPFLLFDTPVAHFRHARIAAGLEPKPPGWEP
jgi:hypothetical protein